MKGNEDKLDNGPPGTAFAFAGTAIPVWYLAPVVGDRRRQPASAEGGPRVGRACPLTFGGAFEGHARLTEGLAGWEPVRMLLPLASKVPNNGFQRRTNHGLSAGGPSWHNCRPATSSLLGYPGVLGGRNVEVEIPPV